MDTLSSDEIELWNNILNLRGRTLVPLADRKSQYFKIIEAANDIIKIKFFESATELKLEKFRFVHAYRHLKKNKGKWIEIGASRVNTDPNSIEGAIKLAADGKMNGLSTATWVAKLLVECSPNVIFNRQLKNQSLMYDE